MATLTQPGPRTSADAAPLPLRIERDLVDRVETLWLGRSRLLFDTRATWQDVASAAGRFGRLVHGVARRGAVDHERLGAHCLVELHGAFPARVAAALMLLLSLAPEIARGASLRRARPGSFAFLDALRHAGRASVTSDLSARELDAASYRGPASEAWPPLALLTAAAFVPGSRRAALLAAARMPRVPRALVDEMERDVHDGTSREARSLALYSLGLAAPSELDGRTHGVRELEEVPHAFFLLGAFGGQRSFSRLVDAYAKRPDPRLVRAAGLFHLAEARDVVLHALESGAPALAITAAVTTWELTGELPWRGRLDRREGEPDAIAAARALSTLPAGIRVREGRPIEERCNEGSMAARWLCSLRARHADPLRFEHPDGMFGEGYGGDFGPFDLGAEERAETPLPRCPWVLEPWAKQAFGEHDDGAAAPHLREILR